MKAKILSKISGQFSITVEPQAEAILSPDGTLKLLPCDTCFELHWNKLNVVSFLCDDCYRDYLWDNFGSKTLVDQKVIA